MSRCWSCDTSRISLRKRSAVVLTCSSGCRTLSATGVWSGASARNTRAAPPRPISRSTAYLPASASRTSGSRSRGTGRHLGLQQPYAAHTVHGPLPPWSVVSPAAAAEANATPGAMNGGTQLDRASGADVAPNLRK